MAVGDDPNHNIFEDSQAPLEPKIEDLKIASQFIEELKAATLESSKLGVDARSRLRNPTFEPIPDTLDPFL